MILRIVLLIISYLLLIAHFLREGEVLLTALYLLVPFFLIIKKKWSLILLQIFIYGGVLVWIQTLFSLIVARIDMGAPWLRMAIILGVVILITLISGLLLNSRLIKEKYSKL